MNAFNDIAEEVDLTRSGTLGLSETYWGYIVREKNAVWSRFDLRELVFLFFGAVMFLVAFGQWLLPGATVSAEILPIKIAITAVFTGIGGAFWHATSGGQKAVEVHVDTALRELRFVEKDRASQGHLTRRIKMGDIDSIYIAEVDGEDTPSHLLVQLGEDENPLHVATASQRELRVLRDRLKRDLRPAAERVERRLMRQAEDAMEALEAQGMGARLSA